MQKLDEVKHAIQDMADSEKGAFLQRFFKTGEGQYGFGDRFMGLTVPQSRSIAKQFKDLRHEDVLQLLHSPIHEERLIALVILTIQYKKGDSGEKKKIYDLYLSNTKYINNWDLVDLSAEYIVGDWLYTHEGSNPEISSEVLQKLATSENLWERRIAIIATFAWIKNGEADQTFVISEILLHDDQDLIHKAVGWMLREVGKRISEAEEEAFLKPRYKMMPRTMLRYAIERFSEEKRKRYLKGMI